MPWLFSLCPFLPPGPLSASVPSVGYDIDPTLSADPDGPEDVHCQARDAKVGSGVGRLPEGLFGEGEQVSELLRGSRRGEKRTELNQPISLMW